MMENENEMKKLVSGSLQDFLKERVEEIFIGIDNYESTIDAESILNEGCRVLFFNANGLEINGDYNFFKLQKPVNLFDGLYLRNLERDIGKNLKEGEYNLSILNKKTFRSILKENNIKSMRVAYNSDSLEDLKEDLMNI